MSAIKKWLRPNVVIPVLLVGGLVAALLSLTNIGKVLALMVSFPPIDLLLFLALMVAYEVVRGVQWIVLLRALRLKSSLRTELFAFSVSEVTKALPIGNYVQNYLLQESEQREDFGRTSAATTLIILLEVGVSLLGVLILGDGSWTTPLRILIVVGVTIAAIVFWLGLKYGQAHDAPQWMQKRKFLRATLEKLHNFANGVRDLLHPRTLALAAGLSALYLVIAAVGLFVIALGLRIPVTFTQTLSVYLLSLAISLIFPLPVDIGVLEISMLGAFAAVGVNRNAGLGASLLNRILSIGASIVLTAIALTILNRELRTALRSGRKRRARQSEKGKQGQPEPQGKTKQQEPPEQLGEQGKQVAPQSAPRAQPQPVPALAISTMPTSPTPPMARSAPAMLVGARQVAPDTASRRATLTVVGVALAVVLGVALALRLAACVAARRRSGVPLVSRPARDSVVPPAAKLACEPPRTAGLRYGASRCH